MKNNLVTASVVLILLTGLSKITGFIREMVLAYFYGASAMTDAYITATTVATILIGGITSATALAYIPRATEARVKNQDVSYITSNLMTACGLLILIISVTAMFFSRELTWLFAMGFDGQTLTLAAGMTFLILPFCFIYAMNNIAAGYLQSINSFWFLGASAILANIVIITAISISNNNPHMLALGFACSWVVPAVWAFFLTRKNGAFLGRSGRIISRSVYIRPVLEKDHARFRVVFDVFRCRARDGQSVSAFYDTYAGGCRGYARVICHRPACQLNNAETG